MSDAHDRSLDGGTRAGQLWNQPADWVISPRPSCTKSWFHPGPVAAFEAGGWTELDLRLEYSGFDTPMVPRPSAPVEFLTDLPRDTRRTVLRTLRGLSLRTDLYALDGTDREPYTVTESISGVRGGAGPGSARERIFLRFSSAASPRSGNAATSR